MPRLKELQKEFATHREAAKLEPFAERISKIIEKLENTAETEELRSLKS